MIITFERILRRSSLLILCSIWLQVSFAQKDHRALRQGDKAYRQEQFDQAEDHYRSALEADNSAKGNYNLGNTAYQQGQFEEAAKRFEEASRLADNEQLQADAYHNLGNAYYQQGEIEKAIEAYKNSLRRTPDDMETKYNLAKAINSLPPPQPESEDEQQEESEEQDQQDQQQQEQDQQDQQQEQEQEQEPSESQDDGQSESESKPEDAKPMEEKPLSREEAERLLEIVEGEEQETMEKLQRSQGRSCTSVKEW